MDAFKKEVNQGQRFEFGENWSSFLYMLDENRIKIAEDSIIELVQIKNLNGKKFLDIGSGSGLFSLAARRLGATVLSFDYDPTSIECTEELRSRYFPDDEGWIITQGSALDKIFLDTLGNFDIIYSWGVLHHTGQMWNALEYISHLVDKDGLLIIAIYNDQGFKSRIWWNVKKTYCSSALGKNIVLSIFIPLLFMLTLISSIKSRKNRFSEYKKNRGMSIIHDWIDWLGGFPFEYAAPEKIIKFFENTGFKIIKLKSTRSLGNNQFVFQKIKE